MQIGPRSHRSERTGATVRKPDSLVFVMTFVARRRKLESSFEMAFFAIEVRVRFIE
jgi:hypothetical protein